MSDNNEVYSLVIQNLKMIEQTKDVLDEIEITVFNRIDEYFERWVKNKGWKCEGSFWNDDIQKLFPQHWDGDISYFSFDLDEDIDNENISWLSYLSGTENIRLGIYWHFIYGNKASKYNLTQWKKELRSQYQNANNLIIFQKNKTDIVYKDRGLFIPITVDSKLLAENYPNNLDVALEEPINEALGYLDNIFPVIDKIYQNSINHTRPE